jgi:hypothetical protein
MIKNTKQKNYPMTYNWNETEVQNKANNFANEVGHELFATNDRISGAEIMSATEIKQINLFVLKELFEKWGNETSKLKSKYFDFDHDEVKKALSDFMNVLSRYISIEKVDFVSLLTNATKQTIELYVDPHDFFVGQLRNLPEFKLTQEWLKSNDKFFKDYNWVLRELSNRLNGVSFVYANEGIEWLNDLKFSEISIDHQNVLKIIDEKGGAPIQDAVQSSSSFFDGLLTQNSIDIDYHPMPNQKGSVDEVSSNQVSLASNIPEVLVSKKADIKSSELEVVTINESLIKHHESKNSLSDFHQRRKIDSIKGNISLNQKYLFINNLFGGNEASYNLAIEDLEMCSVFGEAKELMIKKYLPQFKWDLKSPEAEEFFELLKRRFS